MFLQKLIDPEKLRLSAKELAALLFSESDGTAAHADLLNKLVGKIQAVRVYAAAKASGTEKPTLDPSLHLHIRRDFGSKSILKVKCNYLIVNGLYIGSQINK